MTTLFVATTGGHLAQLKNLSERIPCDGPALWVTSRNEQSTSLLAGRDVEYVRPVGCRSIRGVLRCAPIAHRLWRERGITRAVSTGSGIALGFLPYLAARGVECHYIESAARVNGPSLTGRVLRWVPGVRVYTQYPHLAGGRWGYGGSQFDIYRPVRIDRPFGDLVRVVVTVGASVYPFRRLIESLVPLLAPDGELHRATGTPVHTQSVMVKLAWLTGDGSDQAGGAERWCALKDFVFEAFTGEFATDHSLASGSGLQDMRELQWHPGALEVAGVRAEQLPELKAPTDTLPLA